MSFEILGVDLYHILSWFIVYSFMGWIWESCYVSAKSKKWVNRGFVSGPIVTIYGVGAVTVYVILRPVAGNILELYFAGVAVATILEYVTGVLMEAIFHTNWWDYSDKKFNFQGKICLGSSVAWGFFTLILFYVFQPVVGDLVEMVPRKTGIVLVYIWLAGYTVDFAFSAAAAFDLRNKMKKLDVVWDEFQENLRDTKLYEVAEEARAKAEVYRMELPVGKWNDMIEERKKLFRETSLKSEPSKDFVDRTGILNHKVHNISHDQSGDHNRKIYDGTYHFMPCKLGIQKQCKCQSQYVL